MTSQLFSADVEQVLDLSGIFVFALSGGLLAVRKNFDVFGIAVLAEATALGGGVVRDLLIGAVPPVAFTDTGYFVTPLVATLVVFFLHPEVARINRTVQTLDALGLGLFCVTGTAKAHDFGLGVVASIVLGVVTAAGGGVIRDVLANEIPSLLRWDRSLYAVPALVGGALTALLISVDALNAVTGSASALFAFGLRMMAIKFEWHAPRAWHRGSSSSGEA